MARTLYFPHLDGLRFLAFLAVFFHHSFHTERADIQAHPVFQALLLAKRPGHLGVSFFFVLSGFLITYLLLEERAVTGRINVPYFYLRRVLRIWPLYYAMLLVGFVGFPLLKQALHAPGTETASPLMYLLFLGNFDVIAKGTVPDSSVLGVLWSLAVEEQFYVVWPLLLSLVMPRHLPKLFLALVAGSLVYRWLHHDDTHRLTFSTFSVASDMVVGAALAYHCRNRSRLVAWLGRLGRGQIALGYLLGGALVIYLDLAPGGPLPVPVVVVKRLITALFFAFVIWEQNESRSSLVKVGKSPLMTSLGKVSYGLYCLHPLGILMAIYLNKLVLHLNQTWWQVVFVETALALGLTIGLSLLSWAVLERPILRIKERFSLLRKTAP